METFASLPKNGQRDGKPIKQNRQNCADRQHVFNLRRNNRGYSNFYQEEITPIFLYILLSNVIPFEVRTKKFYDGLCDRTLFVTVHHQPLH